MGEREPKGQLESGNENDGSPRIGQVDETHEQNLYLNDSNTNFTICKSNQTHTKHQIFIHMTQFDKLTSQTCYFINPFTVPSSLNAFLLIDPLHVCGNAANLEDKTKEIFASVKKYI